MDNMREQKGNANIGTGVFSNDDYAQYFDKYAELLIKYKFYEEEGMNATDIHFSDMQEPFGNGTDDNHWFVTWKDKTTGEYKCRYYDYALPSKKWNNSDIKILQKTPQFSKSIIAGIVSGGYDQIRIYEDENGSLHFYGKTSLQGDNRFEEIPADKMGDIKFVVEDGKLTLSTKNSFWGEIKFSFDKFAKGPVKGADYDHKEKGYEVYDEANVNLQPYYDAVSEWEEAVSISESTSSIVRFASENVRSNNSKVNSESQSEFIEDSESTSEEEEANRSESIDESLISTA